VAPFPPFQRREYRYPPVQPGCAATDETQKKAVNMSRREGADQLF